MNYSFILSSFSAYHRRPDDLLSSKPFHFRISLYTGQSVSLVMLDLFSGAGSLS